MISLIGAIQKKDRGLGKNNDLLFKISDDLKRFKELTFGNVIIMGRKTFESIRRPLHKRFNIIISKNKNLKISEAIIVSSLEEAIKKAKDFKKDIFIIGGGEIYKQSINLADRLYLTIIDGNLKADTFFPDYSQFTKIILKEDRHDPETNLSYQYLTLEK